MEDELDAKRRAVVMANTASSHGRHVQAVDKAEEWLVRYAVNRGQVGVTDRELNVKERTRRGWEERYPWFRAKKNMILAQFMSERIVDKPDLWAHSFETFRKVFFGRDTQPHQSRLVEVLDNIAPREVILVLLWPEAGKSATLEDWVCRKVALDPDVRITYLGESTDHAKRVLGFIKDRMTSNEAEWVAYQAKFGPFYIQGQEDENKPWTQNYVTVYKASSTERDRTIQCRAVTSRAYGSRVDILICDDLQSRQTYMQTDKIMEALRQTYFTRGKRMTTVIVGNRIGPADIYDRMIEEWGDKPWFHLVQLVAAHGTEPTVPEAWADREDYDDDASFLEASRANLAVIREQVDEEVWWSSYQQNPRANTLVSFTSQMIEDAKDYNRPIGNAAPGTFVTLSLDPALGGMNALIACAYHPDRLELLDLQTDTHLTQTEQILDRIDHFAIRYHARQVIIEKNAFQQGLANDHRLRALAAKHGFVVRSHLTGGEKNSEVFGVAAMPGSFNARQVRIPWGDEPTRHRFKPLVDQLDAWRPNVPTRLIRQDTVMALWFAWKHWETWRQSVKVTTTAPASRPGWLRGLVGSRG